MISNLDLCACHEVAPTFYVCHLLDRQRYVQLRGTAGPRVTLDSDRRCYAAVFVSLGAKQATTRATQATTNVLVHLLKLQRKQPIKC